MGWCGRVWAIWALLSTVGPLSGPSPDRPGMPTAFSGSMSPISATNKQRARTLQTSNTAAFCGGRRGGYGSRGSGGQELPRATLTRNPSSHQSTYTHTHTRTQAQTCIWTGLRSPAKNAMFSPLPHSKTAAVCGARWGGYGSRGRKGYPEPHKPETRPATHPRTHPHTLSLSQTQYSPLSLTQKLQLSAAPDGEGMEAEGGEGKSSAEPSPAASPSAQRSRSPSPSPAHSPAPSSTEPSPTKK